MRNGCGEYPLLAWTKMAYCIVHSAWAERQSSNTNVTSLVPLRSFPHAAKLAAKSKNNRKLSHCVHALRV